MLAKEKLVHEKHQGYDIITVQDQYYLALVGLLLAKKFKIGLEIQIHGFEKYSGLRKLIVKFVIPKANAVRTVSQRLKKRLAGEFGVEEDRITVVPVYSYVGCRMSDVGHKSDGKFIFLTVGRLVPVKNIEMQINALANIVKKYSNVELWIVGEGEEKEKLLNLCYALRVTRYAKFLGWQSHVDEFYGKADAFLLTSHSEGWGLAVVEAARCGLPIIMTNVGCAGELIVDSESGIVIPAGDQEKLEENMVKLIEDKELRSKLGENARQAVLKLPSIAETLNLYKKSWENALKFRK
ncbi:glycosyltransferase family 4 protein [Patescibacteria group bacterium]|nr:glycosyltransferase family 4 protein [Patescibacteria group bacterium]